MTTLSKFDIELLAKQVSSNLIEHGQDMNESIAKIAISQALNREQVQRIVECSNTMANAGLVHRAKVAGEDPRISFQMADATKIAARTIGESAAFSSGQNEGAAKLASMFVVPTVKEKIELPAFDKTAQAAMKKLSSMSGSELAALYVRGASPPNEDFTARHLLDAREALEELQKIGRENWALVDNQEAATVNGLAAEVEGQLRMGLTPATIRSIVGRADVLDDHKKMADELITEIAKLIDVDEGVAQVKQASVVDEQHPLFLHMNELLVLDGMRDQMLATSESFETGLARLDADIAKATAGNMHKIAFDLGTAAHLAGKAKKVGGGAMQVFGAGLNAAEVSGRARESTLRLKKMQQTPAVGPMKVANFGLTPSLKDVGRAALTTAGATMALVAADKLLGAGSSVVGGIFERRKRDRLFERILEREPQLKSNPRTREYFDLVMQYAPALGENVVAVSDFLKKQMQFPATSLEFVQSLAQLQKTIRDGRGGGHSFFQEAGTGVLGKAQAKWME